MLIKFELELLFEAEWLHLPRLFSKKIGQVRKDDKLTSSDASKCSQLSRPIETRVVLPLPANHVSGYITTMLGSDAENIPAFTVTNPLSTNQTALNLNRILPYSISSFSYTNTHVGVNASVMEARIKAIGDCSGANSNRNQASKDER